MAFEVTRAARRNVMVVLLGLALAGAAIRHFAANPSTLRDVGTLMLVLWLPVVGNLIAWLVGKVPRKPRPAVDFPAGAAFTPHLEVQATANPLNAQEQAAANLQDVHCILVMGRQGFRARLPAPLASVLSRGAPFRIELLHPAVGLPLLGPGTEFHVLAGATAVARGRVLAHLPSATVAG